MDNNKTFVKDVIEFYDAFLGNVADSIESLAKLQETHKEGYKKLKEIQIDPTKLLEKFKDMDVKKKAILLNYFMEASLFEQRLIKLFKLSAEEQKNLSKDLKDFLNRSKELIKDLS